MNVNQKYELWRDDESNFMLGTPCPDRGQHIHAPGARLLLRFTASSTNAARLIYEQFLFGGNPDNLTSLDIPASHFFFPKYRNGICAGAIVQLKTDGVFDAGTSFEILPGDIENPQHIWMRVIHSPSDNAIIGQFHFVQDDENFFSHFEETTQRH